MTKKFFVIAVAFVMMMTLGTSSAMASSRVVKTGVYPLRNAWNLSAYNYNSTSTMRSSVVWVSAGSDFFARQNADIVMHVLNSRGTIVCYGKKSSSNRNNLYVNCPMSRKAVKIVVSIDVPKDGDPKHSWSVAVSKA